MTPIIDKVFDELAVYRDHYRDGGFDIPEHEIVMNSQNFANLMGAAESRVFLGGCYPDKKFAGAVIVVAEGYSGFTVRDRTMVQHGNR